MSSTADAPRSPAPVVAGIDVATAAVRVVCADARGQVLAEGAGSAAPAGTRRGRPQRAGRPRLVARAAAALAAGHGRAARRRPGGPGGRRVRHLRDAGPGGRGRGARRPGPDVRRPAAAGLNAKAQGLGAPRWRALGLTVGPTAALGKLVWYANRSRPGRLLLHTPDLLGHRLTGHPVATDWSHALKTGYDPRAGEWATEVFDAFGVSSGLLPAVRAPGTEAGTVSARAAAEPACPSAAGSASA